MDPYVVLKLGSQSFRTKTHSNAGKQPSWFDVFEFQRTNEEALELSVYDDDIGKDDLVGSGIIYVSKLCVPGAKHFSDSIKLTYKDKEAGDLYVDIDFYPDKK